MCWGLHLIHHLRWPPFPSQGKAFGQVLMNIQTNAVEIVFYILIGVP